MNNRQKKNARRQSSLFSLLYQGMQYVLTHPVETILYVFVIQATLAKAQYPKTKPVAYYPLAGNALDSSGNNNHGIEFNIKYTTDAFGRAYSAAHMDGKSFIKGPADNFPTDAITVLYRFKADIYPLAPGRNKGGFWFGYGGHTLPADCNSPAGLGGTSFIIIQNNNANAAPNSYEVQAHCDTNYVFYTDPNMFTSPSEWIDFAVTSSYETGTKIYINDMSKPVVEDLDVYFKNTFVAGTDFGIGTGVDPTTGKAPWGIPDSPYARGSIATLLIDNFAYSGDELTSAFNSSKPILPPTLKPIETCDAPSWPLQVLLGIFAAGAVGAAGGATVAGIKQCTQAKTATVVDDDDLIDNSVLVQNIRVNERSSLNANSGRRASYNSYRDNSPARSDESDLSLNHARVVGAELEEPNQLRHEPALASHRLYSSNRGRSKTRAIANSISQPQSAPVSPKI